MPIAKEREQFSAFFRLERKDVLVVLGCICGIYILRTCLHLAKNQVIYIQMRIYYILRCTSVKTNSLLDERAYFSDR